MIETRRIHYALEKAKIVAIVKPGKPNGHPQYYQPIAILSIIYKLSERLIYNRISGGNL